MINNLNFRTEITMKKQQKKNFDTHAIYILSHHDAFVLLITIDMSNLIEFAIFSYKTILDFSHFEISKFEIQHSSFSTGLPFFAPCIETTQNIPFSCILSNIHLSLHTLNAGINEFEKDDSLFTLETSRKKIK